MNTNPIVNIVAQPANKGKALLQLIDAAKNSIDIVIYEINSTEIISHLVNAMGNRGVRVRTVMDCSSETTKTTNSSFVQGMKQAMSAWTQNGKPAPLNADLFAPQWASTNFNVTHQKSVIVDAVDAAGHPLSPLPDSARLLISTGNFADYDSTPFYSATDFYVTITNPVLIQQASAVFGSDFNHDGPTVNNANNGTQTPGGPLIWSNGAWATAKTKDPDWPLNQYPAAKGYPYPLPNPHTFADEGNVSGYLQALIQSAQQGDVLRIYNEEFDSNKNTNPVYKALLDAASRGVDVRLMMSYGSGSTDDFAEYQAKLARKGGTVTLLAPQAYLESIANYTGPTYIHAKALVLSASNGSFKQGWVGSTNIGNNALFSNRELGIALRPSDVFAATIIVEQFDSDWGWYQATPSTPIYAIRWTKDNVGKHGHPAAPPEWTSHNLAATTHQTGTTSSASNGRDASAPAPIRESIQKIMHANCHKLLDNMKAKHPGMGVGISVALFFPQDASVQPFYHFGHTGLSGPDSVINPDSVYAIGSVTKVFTATLAAHLQVTGKIGKLGETLVGPYLSNSGCNLAGVSGDYWKEATFLDFATQTSGMPDEEPGKPSKPLFANQPPSCKTLNWWNEKQGEFAENRGLWIYSSAGFVTLGFATAAAAQAKPNGGYTNLLKHVITGPLAMTKTFAADDVPPQAILVQGYNEEGPVPITNAADLKSSARDMLLWMAAIHEAIELKANGARLSHLQEALALTAKTWIVNPELPNNKIDDFDMGLGWQIPKIGSTQILMKNGSTSEGGCSCWIGLTRYHPSLPPIGIALLTNQIGVRPDATAHTILEQILSGVNSIH